MNKLLLTLFLAASVALVAACGDDDDDGDSILDPSPTATATADVAETPTAEPTSEPTAEPTADPTTEPTDEPDDDLSACADTPADVLPTVLQALGAGDAEAVFNCFSSDARALFGPDLDSFENGDFSSFSEGLGSFPVDTPVILSEEIENASEEQVAVIAIAGDRTVEGMDEDNAIYAVLAKFEDGSWRMDPAAEFSFSEFSPEPLSTVPAGALTIAVNVTDIDASGDTPDVRLFFNGGAVIEPIVENFEGIRISGLVTVQAGANYAIVFVESAGEFGVFGWSFVGE